MLSKEIVFFGRKAILACDGKCNKAFGCNSRPTVQLNPDNEDDYCYLADGELEEAPIDPKTYEGGEGKPQTDEEKLNKWCARECERSEIFKPHEKIKLPDFSVRNYNIQG